MKEEMSIEEILKEQRRLERQAQRIDKIIEISGYVLCLAAIFILIVHFI